MTTRTECPRAPLERIQRAGATSLNAGKSPLPKVWTLLMIKPKQYQLLENEERVLRHPHEASLPRSRCDQERNREGKPGGTAEEIERERILPRGSRLTDRVEGEPRKGRPPLFKKKNADEGRTLNFTLYQRPLKGRVGITSDSGC